MIRKQFLSYQSRLTPLSGSGLATGDGARHISRVRRVRADNKTWLVYCDRGTNELEPHSLHVSILLQRAMPRVCRASKGFNGHRAPAQQGSQRGPDI